MAIVNSLNNLQISNLSSFVYHNGTTPYTFTHAAIASIKLTTADGVKITNALGHDYKASTKVMAEVVMFFDDMVDDDLTNLVHKDTRTTGYFQLKFLVGASVKTLQINKAITYVKTGVTARGYITKTWTAEFELGDVADQLVVSET